MKKYFWLGLLLWVLFELMNVYFIMPFPGSQQMESIGLAYFLYKWRWMFRLFFSLLIISSYLRSDWRRRWIPWVALILPAFLIYVVNFKLQADQMFYPPSYLKMVSVSENKVDTSLIVLGLANDGEARAYPIQFLGFHHQVIDTLTDKPVMITYCTVCRTGRIFEPKVKGAYEKFRLVGMDHFNAMFEDAKTHSWWRQVNGECVAGKLKGEMLPEIFCVQSSLGHWMQLHPNTLIMQPDTSFSRQYSAMKNYESGKSKSSLTYMDSLSWKDKSWIAGIKTNGQAKAYDWNHLKAHSVIHDKVGETPVLIVLAGDGKSLYAFERNSHEDQFSLSGDTLSCGEKKYTLDGKELNGDHQLKRISAYQEYWHSWRTFNKNTAVF